jgi:hypothetical protein
LPYILAGGGMVRLPTSHPPAKGRPNNVVHSIIHTIPNAVEKKKRSENIEYVLQ